jgi:hypothetical protein
MTKRRTRKKPAPTVTIADAPVAVAALGLDVPYYQVRLVGNRLEFHLYGGNVVYWPDAPAEQDPANDA